MLLWSVLQQRRAFFARYGVAAFTADFLLSVAAILLATTLYAGAPLLLNAFLVGPALGLAALPPRGGGVARRREASHPAVRDGKAVSNSDERDALPVRPFLTAYRGSMMVVTCVSILAVDFRVFPRRFAKVENWGTSLMDMGVGSFVFSAGVVGARPILRDRLAGRAPRLWARLSRSGRHAVPLLLLGFVRLWSVKGLDYAEHVTEYGVHWNFFFTLALLPPFVALFHSAFTLIPSYAVLALLLAAVYEAVLDQTRLKAYVLTAPRTGLLSQNREGIFSFVGYLAIFLAGQATGLYVLPRSVAEGTRPSLRSGAVARSTADGARAERRRLLLRLGAWSLVWSGLLAGTLSYRWGLALRISRRLANLPYVLWVCAFNCSQLLAFCLVETVVFPHVHRAVDPTIAEQEARRATSRILRSYNRNGLAVFLLANLMTGLVNMTVKTLDAGTGTAMAVLVGYAMVLTLVALGLDARGIAIKI